MHGEGDSSLALHMFSSAIQRRYVKLLHHLLRLKVDLRKLQVAEENEAAIVQRVYVDDMLASLSCEIHHGLERPAIVFGLLAVEDGLAYE